MNTYHFILKIFKTFSLAALILFSLSYCTALPTNDVTQTSPSNQLLEKAQLAEALNQYTQASKLYLHLANSQASVNREHYLSLATSASLKTDDSELANLLINSLLDQNYHQTPTTQLLLSSILLKQGKTDQAESTLDSINEKNLNHAQRLELHTQRSSTFFQSGNLIESVRERIILDTLIIQPSARLENQHRLVETLSLISNRALDILLPNTQNNTAGWIELTRVLETQSQLTIEDPAIIEWKARYPTHSANGLFLLDLLQQQKTDYRSPQKIAVFLPNQGPYLSAANSIRKGIISAAYTLKTQWAPNIIFYNTSSRPINSLYQQALDDGAGAIIGPLDKDKVADLKMINKRPIPVIALNKIEGTNHNIFSFSLNPEAELTQLASLAWLKGHQNVLILSPKTRYGERLATHFANTWQQLGGTVLDVESYTANQADYSSPIKKLLNLDQSNNRFKTLRNRLNLNINFEERRRQDANFIFLIASPREGRLIKPQLRFFRAAKLPVYSTSKIYSAKPNKAADTDLNGIYFCDMPSLIDPNDDKTLDANKLTHHWPSLNGSYQRLFRLGLDAYQLIPHINRLDTNSFARLSGETGILSIGQDKNINRQLSCATFTNGASTTTGLAPQLEKTNTIQMIRKPSSSPTNSKTTPL